MTPLLRSRLAFGSLADVAVQFIRGSLLLRKASAWAAAILLCLFVGCVTSHAFKSLDALGTSVDKAVNVYYRLVATRQVRTNDVPAVSRAYAEFQFIYRIAETQMEGNPRGAPDTNVVAHAATVLNMVSKAQGGGQ